MLFASTVIVWSNWLVPIRWCFSVTHLFFCVFVFSSLKDDDSGDHDQDQGSPKDSEKEKAEDEDKEQNTQRKKVGTFEIKLRKVIRLFPCAAWSRLLYHQMVVPGAGEHPLQYNYTFWYSRRTPGRPASTQSYEQNIKQIGSFASVWSHGPTMYTNNLLISSRHYQTPGFNNSCFLVLFEFKLQPCMSWTAFIF